MCEICASMLAAEHRKHPGNPLCPNCNRFPLNAEMRIDPDQWDYVAPELREGSGPPGTTVAPVVITGGSLPFERPKPPAGRAVFETPDPGDDEFEDEFEEGEEENVQTCYHCYQIASGLAERCPVCGDSYLPPELRRPHLA